MTDAVIRLHGVAQPVTVRFDGTNPTFKLETDRIRAKCRSELDPLDVDLLEIAATVFAADSAVKRGGPTRPRMGEDWRRTLDFEIPVRNPEFWDRDDVRHALSDAVRFLTEDQVSFKFMHKADVGSREPFLDLDPTGATFDAEEVILFSGGLDSFAGALEALSTSGKKVILLTHRSAQKAIPRQVKLGEYLANRFSERVLHIHVIARRVGQEASDSSQRSRSFLFAALGQLVAKSFGAKRLSFYENGVISHNLPISKQVVGTMATRTTHPLSLLKLNALMQHLGSNHIPIENRYCWMTKRDVVERIAQNGGAEQIPQSVSCTSIREQTTQHTHCGSCSQCLDRRFALLAAGLGAHDFATDYATDILFGPRKTPQSQTMAVEWSRHALSMSNVDPRRFMVEYGTEFSRIAEGHPDQSKQEILEQCIVMHGRHGKNVEQVFEQVLDQRAHDILRGKLSETSLVALILGQHGSRLNPTLIQNMPVESRVPEVNLADEVDLIPDPAAPLRVTFAEEDGHPVVKIEGICVLTGTEAKVPTKLQPTFLEDRGNHLPLEDHRYVASGILANKLNSSKSAIRQQVNRCRKTLSESYESVHGQPPDPDRFIQSRSPKGYRIAPSVIPVDEEES